MHSSCRSKQQKKRARDGTDDVAAAAVLDRATAAAELMATAQHHRVQVVEFSKLAVAMESSATRSLQQCADDTMALVQADAARAQPLLDLHHKMDVSCY